MTDKVYIAKRGGQILEVCEAFETACLHLKKSFPRAAAHMRWSFHEDMLYAYQGDKVVGTVLSYQVTPRSEGL